MYATNLFFSLDANVSIQYFDKFVKISTIYFLIQICFRDIHTIKYFFRTFIFSFFYLSVDSLRYFSGSRLDNYGLTDANDANTIAVVAVMALIVILLRLDFKKYKLESSCFLIFSIFVVNFIAMTRSRGAFIGIVVACFWFLVSDKQVKKSYMIFFHNDFFNSVLPHF